MSRRRLDNSLLLDITKSIREIGYYPTKMIFGSEAFYFFLCKRPNVIPLFFLNGFHLDELHIFTEASLGELFLNILLDKKGFSREKDKRFFLDKGVSLLELEREGSAGGYEPTTIIMFLYYQEIFSKEKTLQFLDDFIEIADMKTIENVYFERYQPHAMKIFKDYLSNGDVGECLDLFISKN